MRTVLLGLVAVGLLVLPSWASDREEPTAAAEDSSKGGTTACDVYALKDIQLGMTIEEAAAKHPGAKVKERRRLGKLYGKGRAWAIQKDYLKKKAKNPVYVWVILDKPGGSIVFITAQYTSYGGITQTIKSQVPNDVLLKAFVATYGEPQETRPFEQTDQRHVVIDTVTTELEGDTYVWKNAQCGVILEVRLGQRRSTVGTYAYSKSESIYPLQSASLTTLEFKAEMDKAQQEKVKL